MYHPQSAPPPSPYRYQPPPNPYPQPLPVSYQPYHYGDHRTASLYQPPNRHTASASASGSGGDSTGPSAAALLRAPAHAVPMNELVRVHLDDLETLTAALLATVQHQASGAVPAPAPAGAAAAAAAAAAASAGGDVSMADAAAAAAAAAAGGTALASDWSASMPLITQKILDKDARLQVAVEKLAAHERLQNRVAALDAERMAHTHAIVSFAAQLSACEQKLHDAIARASDQPTNKDIDGVYRQQRFDVESVLLFAERLGVMSFAPADYIERKGLTTTVCRPPAPLEELMGLSRLHLSLDELAALNALNDPTLIAPPPAATAAAAAASAAAAPAPAAAPASAPAAPAAAAVTVKLESKQQQPAITSPAGGSAPAPMATTSPAGASVPPPAAGGPPPGSLEAALRNFKPHAGWKPGDPLDPAHLQMFLQQAGMIAPPAAASSAAAPPAAAAPSAPAKSAAAITGLALDLNPDLLSDDEGGGGDGTGAGDGDGAGDDAAADGAGDSKPSAMDDAEEWTSH